jgi:hypothetical protein
MRTLLIVIFILLTFITNSCTRKSIAALKKQGLTITQQALTLHTKEQQGRPFSYNTWDVEDSSFGKVDLQYSLIHSFHTNAF